MKKINLKTIFLSIIIIISIAVIFYFTAILMRAEDKSKNNSNYFIQTKIKAESKTYTRILSLNNSSVTPTISPTTTDQSLFSTTLTQQVPVSSPTVSPELTPSPTEVVLAYNNLVETTPTISRIITLSPMIPETGSIHPSIVIFSTALFFLLLSLIY